ncbi:general secretion pathway protein GspB [Congregibacter sp.]|uniref:general secretion pathway protein GspB n=1 Tax=Congregibacter sp. TaxID=2744308 RepID=UPI003F6CE3D8
MSLILDALSRAEREKREEASPAPGILAQETPPGRSVGRTGIKSLVVAAVVCLVFLALATLLITLRSTTTAPDLIKPVAVSLSANQTTRQVDTAVRAQQSSPTDEEALAKNIASEKRQASSLEQDAAVAALYARPAESAIDETDPRSPASQPDAATGVEAPPVQTAQSLSEREIDVEQVLREVRAQAANSGLQPHPASLLEDLTKRFKDSVPTLMYSRHDYSSSGRSTVTINGTSLTPGQRTRGVEVLDILSDSVILRFQGSEFRLRALNSWVNL